MPEKKTKKAAKKSPGRPATGRLRSCVIQIRASAEERESLRKQADAAGLSLHAWVRRKLGLDSAE